MLRAGASQGSLFNELQWARLARQTLDSVSGSTGLQVVLGKLLNALDLSLHNCTRRGYVVLFFLQSTFTFTKITSFVMFVY